MPKSCKLEMKFCEIAFLTNVCNTTYIKLKLVGICEILTLDCIIIVSAFLLLKRTNLLGYGYFLPELRLKLK